MNKSKLSSEQIGLRISSIIMLLISVGGILTGVLMLLADSREDLTVPALAILVLGVLAAGLAFVDHKALSEEVSGESV